ncbi:DUF1329 domain-containing protein [Variovorax sp. WS11]|uniref:DUF1329 domain-containing protein n=1 Tax=Variovorax sp. WS11 TaxID=1105204 RepID=UPI000D0E27A7|nr:DUF1329 domain-containing protein [Variovorax sp. WS11]NDZ17743.1 DUF1329 domain-containing protein [Variovorax sp. WS11]PSL80454.1 DUF1329 domain-containing protein [Variovorax sp. WS11]
MNKRWFGRACVAGVVMGLAQAAVAAVSAEEAKKLGSTLTEFGAEKAGNADGSIPAYTGGISAPTGYKKGDDLYVDPFKDEKPLYTIDTSNMERYSAVLTEGAKAMLKQLPSYRLDVYKTHRSVRYAPWVLENTLKNASSAKLEGDVEGDSMSGADAGGLPFPGVPFPIPKTGYEVMWNHKLRFGPAVMHSAVAAWLVDASGTPSPLPTTTSAVLHPWYDQSGKLRKETFDAVFGFSSPLTSPPSSAGVHFLGYYLANSAEGGQKMWFYTPGQRRVRSAPEFNYDIPIASYGGVMLWDELYGFVGRMDRFDFKLVGKKDLIVPYNAFKVTNGMASKDTLDAKHMKPEVLRWEKHRVWVVEATRKAGARHAYSKRTFYVDEDSWGIVSSESYDDAGKLWRVNNIYSFPTYDIGGVNDIAWSTNDLIKGNYFVVDIGGKDPGGFYRSYPSAEGVPGLKLTPQSVAAGSAR